MIIVHFKELLDKLKTVGCFIVLKGYIKTKRPKNELD